MGTMHNQLILRGNNLVYLKNISVWPVNDCLWTWRCCKNERLSISRNRKTQSHRSSTYTRIDLLRPLSLSPHNSVYHRLLNSIWANHRLSKQSKNGVSHIFETWIEWNWIEKRQLIMISLLWQKDIVHSDCWISPKNHRNKEHKETLPP